MPARVAALAVAASFALSCCARADDAAALRAALAAERSRPATPRLERDRFLSKSPIRAAALSPDGRSVAWLEIVDLSAPPELRLRGADGAERKLLARTAASSVEWSRDGRWIFLAGEESVWRVEAGGARDAGRLASLGGESHRRFAGVDPVRPAAVLLAEEPATPGEGPTRIVALEVDGAVTTLFESSQPVGDVALDASGRAAFARLRDGERYRIVRVADGAPGEELASCERLARCAFASARAADGGVWIEGNLTGDRVGLERLAPGGAPRSVHRDPRALTDLDAVFLDATSAVPRFAAYRGGAPAVYALERRDEAALARLRGRFPAEELRIQASAGGAWLVERRSDRLQVPRWELLDPATGESAPLFEPATRRATKLEPGQAARKIFFRYRAADGLAIPGWLTVPPGRDPARLALVARVHGGPWNHAGPGFDPWDQLLAARGIAVFEPEFRGSTGYGRAHLFAAGGDFGDGRVRRDIDDGVRFLLAAGVGDPARVGIVGASFGGYSALLGLTVAPDLYRAGIAFVPPTDFGWAVRFMAERDRPRGAEMPLATSAKLFGVDPADPVLAARLARESPAARPEAMRRPLLVVAGGEDDRVALRSVLDYAARLESLGRELSLYVAPDSGHSTDDPREREIALALAERFLERHLGAEPPTPYEDREGRLARQLRLDRAGVGAATPAVSRQAGGR